MCHPIILSAWFFGGTVLNSTRVFISSHWRLLTTSIEITQILKIVSTLQSRKNNWFRSTDTRHSYKYTFSMSYQNHYLSFVFAFPRNRNVFKKLVKLLFLLLYNLSGILRQDRNIPWSSVIGIWVHRRYHSVSRYHESAPDVELQCLGTGAKAMYFYHLVSEDIK